jgi:TIR domain
MFITLQFPLFDYRYIKTNPNRPDKPRWQEPGENERIRYFGNIFGRNIPYYGPWDDEKKYCNARSVINTCGMGEEHFYKLLFLSPAGSRIYFRRFQSDGKCMARFDVGFNDHFEKVLAAEKPTPETIAEAIYDQIRRYLFCPVKVKTGNKLSAFVPLVNAGSRLRSAYYWATSPGEKTFMDKDISGAVDNCEPAILLQLDASKLNLSAMQMEKVEVPGISDDELQLFYQYIPYTIGRRRYNIKAWIICTNGGAGTNPALPEEFGMYNKNIRYLRINLLRIHTEIILQNKLMGIFSTTNEAYKINDVATRVKLYEYLHKIWLNLSNIKRNRQPQDKLVQIGFELNERYYGGPGVDEQMELLQHYEDWLKGLTPGAENEQVKKYVKDNVSHLEQKKVIAAKQPTVFISYNHADETTAALLTQKLEAEQIKVILDSADMMAGESIEQFIIDSIKNSVATVSIVSGKSLSSPWVGIETAYSLTLQKFFKQRKFIACYIDQEFLDKELLVSKTIDQIDDKLAEIKKFSDEYYQKHLSTVDLDDEKNRLLALRGNLSGIVEHLRNVLVIDIRPGKIDTAMPAIVESIRSSGMMTEG